MTADQTVAVPAQLKLGGVLIALLTAISAVGPLAMNGVLPATTAVMAEFSAGYGATQLVLTVFLIAILIAQVIIGRASDRFGRRPVMVASLAAFSAGSSLCAVAPTLEWLLIARFVQGFVRVRAVVCTCGSGLPFWKPGRRALFVAFGHATNDQTRVDTTGCRACIVLAVVWNRASTRPVFTHATVCVQQRHVAAEPDVHDYECQAISMTCPVMYPDRRADDRNR